MKFAKLTLAILFFAGPLALKAQDIGGQCKDLFEKTYKTQVFIISIEGKKQSNRFLSRAHETLVGGDDPAQINIVLETISEYGVQGLSTEQREFIFRFRLNSSLLRSIFQTSDKSHLSPIRFGRFVKDFGVLKDLLLINENESAQLKAIDILQKYSDLDFRKILKKATPASKKSVALYFTSLLEHTKKIMSKPLMTIDEVHDVRKNLRNVLRYMQIEREILEADGHSVTKEQENAIYFLKKLNTKLGFISDAYSGQIILDKKSTQSDRVTKKTLVEFPIALRPKVEHFLRSYYIIIE